jgi:hypothetical protein
MNSAPGTSPAHRIVAASLAVGAVLGVYWFVRRRQSVATQSVVAVATAETPAWTWPRPTLPVLSFVQLVELTQTQGLLSRIQSDSGLNALTWNELIQPVIERTAEFVQQLPASEADHHAQPGGLWIHMLEVAHHAVASRRGKQLPPHGDAEGRHEVLHIWTVGVLLGALLHDIGKPVSDLKVTLFSPANPNGQIWRAMLGAMPDIGAHAYAVDFPTAAERAATGGYEAHKRLSVTLLQRMLPARTQQWLHGDAGLVDTLIEHLSGDGVAAPLDGSSSAKSNIITTLVKHAEMSSVSANKASGSRVRFASAQVVPMIELLMSALRRMLAEGSLALNKPGSPGYVIGGDVWFYSKSLCDKLREYLTATDPERSKRLPTDNTRWFDELQAYGAIVPNGDKAIWHVMLELPGMKPDKPQTLIRFALAKLFASPERYPIDCGGTITVVSAEASASAAAPGVDQTTTLPVAEVATAVDTVTPEPEQSAAQSIAAVQSTPIPMVRPTLHQEDQTEPKEQTVTAATVTLKFPAIPAALAALMGSPSPPDSPETPEQPQASSSIKARPTVPLFIAAADSAVAGSLASPDGNGLVQHPTPFAGLPHLVANAKSVPIAAQRFIAWVQAGVANGEIAYNAKDALIHFIEFKGAPALLFVSPVVFRRFAQLHGEDGSGTPSDTTEPGQLIQTHFCAAKWHEKEFFTDPITGKSHKGKNIMFFKVQQRKGAHPRSLKGILVREPERFFSPPFVLNPFIAHISEEFPDIPGVPKLVTTTA